ncbi:MAG TPA: hypothetical protein VFT16_01185 [Candidatus Saccharimonadales bacterium]|nr:hypothetical protein [Candidatus Saccharimonadales bacterium]
MEGILDFLSGLFDGGDGGSGSSGGGSSDITFGSSESWGTGANEGYRFEDTGLVHDSGSGQNPVASDSAGNLFDSKTGEPVSRNDTDVHNK